MFEYSIPSRFYNLSIEKQDELLNKSKLSEEMKLEVEVVLLPQTSI